MKIRTMTLGLAFASLAALGPLDAQVGPRDRDTIRRGMTGAAPMLDAHIGRALDRRHELGLSEDQVSRLTELHREAREAMEPLRLRRREVAEGLRAGTMAQADAREAMTTLRETAHTTREALTPRLDEVLEPGQRARLRMDERRSMAGRTGRRAGVERHGVRRPGIQRPGMGRPRIRRGPGG